MRRTAKHSRNEMQTQLVRPLEESDRIDSALLLMATRMGKSLTPERIRQWHDDLLNYPIDAIEWAFDNWSRNAARTPALADILELLNTWNVENQPVGETCQCFAEHDRGYNGNDCVWLFQKIVANNGRFQESMYDELDKKRGRSPDWR